MLVGNMLCSRMPLHMQKYVTKYMTADATTMTSYTRTYLDQTSKREDSLLFRNADAMQGEQ